MAATALLDPKQKACTGRIRAAGGPTAEATHLSNEIDTWHFCGADAVVAVTAPAAAVVVVAAVVVEDALEELEEASTAVVVDGALAAAAAEAPPEQLRLQITVPERWKPGAEKRVSVSVQPAPLPPLPP